MENAVAVETSPNETSKSTTSAEATNKQDATLQNIVKRLTASWTGGIGKSVQSTLRCAAIIAEAKSKLMDYGQYELWLKDVAKMSVRTADKYIMIHDAFGTQVAVSPKTPGTRPNWSKYQDQLPVDWSMMYQFARLYSKISALKKAEKLFLEVYDLSITPEVDLKGVISFPTVADIASVVAEHIIDNDPVKKEERRKGKAAEAEATEKAEAERIAVQEAANSTPAIPDATTGQTVSRQATAPLDTPATSPDGKCSHAPEGEPPTPDQIEAEIAATQDELFADDGNEVVTESFVAAYDTLRLRNKIKALLHQENLTNLEVIVRPKVAA